MILETHMLEKPKMEGHLDIRLFLVMRILVFVKRESERERGEF